MRTIRTADICQTVEKLCLRANTDLPEDVAEAMEKARKGEESPLGQRVLMQLQSNASMAKEQKLAMCQDTGMVVVFADIGQEVSLLGDSLEEAVNEGVRRAYAKGFFRTSVVKDPLRRENTKDNTPAVLHTRIVPGQSVTIRVAPKGFGSENMSQLAMLKPAEGRQGVMDFVVRVVSEAGGNPCPPIIVGVGLGGTFEKAALLAKESLLRPVGEHNPDPDLEKLEKELLIRINQLGIGPQGFGGTVTALAVHVLSYPTHIAGLPVAVNINCHAARHQEAIL